MMRFEPGVRIRDGKSGPMVAIPSGEPIISPMGMEVFLMKKPAITQPMIDFVEDMGIIYEQMGLYRMAGRVIGWLLICDPPQQSPKELAAVLDASKGAISTMVRWLEDSGLVERLRFPGERSTYYRIKPGAWLEVTRAKSAYYTPLKELARRGLTLLDKKDPELKNRLKEMHALQAFFEREIPHLLERFKKEYEQ